MSEKKSAKTCPQQGHLKQEVKPQKKTNMANLFHSNKRSTCYLVSHSYTIYLNFTIRCWQHF